MAAGQWLFGVMPDIAGSRCSENTSGRMMARVGGCWLCDLPAVNAEMLFNGRDALEGVVDLLAVAGHILDAMAQIFQVVADRVQLAVDRPQCLLDHRGYFFADDVANILLRHHPVF